MIAASRQHSVDKTDAFVSKFLGGLRWKKWVESIDRGDSSPHSRDSTSAACGNGNLYPSCNDVAKLSFKATQYKRVGAGRSLANDGTNPRPILFARSVTPVFSC